MTPTIRQALLSDIGPIADNCREADRRELWLAYGKSPREVLEESFTLSGYVRVGLVDDAHVCMFGMVTVAPGVGRPWLITTDAIEPVQVIFLRRCGGVVAEMHEGHDLLTNWVHEKNTLAVKWLKWLGFRMLPAEGVGLEGSVFAKFERRR